MKARHFLLGATLLSAGLLLNAPLFAAVESDIVGYTTIQMDAGKWYQIGNPFVALENGASADVNAVFNSGFAKGDKLYVYNPETQGYDSPLTWGTVTENVWGDENLWQVSSQVVPSGRAVFIHKVSPGVVTLKGRVSYNEISLFGAEDSESWNQIVCVFPTAMTLNEMQWDGLEEGDEAYIFDPAQQGYKSPLTWSSAVTGTTPAWSDLNLWSIDSSKLVPGQAIFVNKKGAGTASCAPMTSDK